MKFGLFTCGYQRNPLPDIFEDAARFGYDYIELWGGRPHAYAPDLINGAYCKELLKLSRDYGVPISVYTPEMNAYPFNLMSGSEKMRIDAVDYVKSSMDAAVMLGAENVLISAGHGGYFAAGTELRDRLQKCLKEICVYAESLDINILLEPLTIYESNICTSCDELSSYLRSVGSSRLYGICDLVVPYVQHESIREYFSRLGNKLRHVHLADSDGHTERHMLPGTGIMPISEIVSEIKDAGYNGSMTIEVVHECMNEPRAYAAKAMSWLHSQSWYEKERE